MDDEAAEGVWGYLLPLSDGVRGALVLKKRGDCSDHSCENSSTKSEKNTQQQTRKRAPGGYLVGRHPECGKCINVLYPS